MIWHRNYNSSWEGYRLNYAFVWTVIGLGVVFVAFLIAAIVFGW